MSSRSFSPSRTTSVSGSSRNHLQHLAFLGSLSRLRSSSFKKPPEPLRRAVADFLSSSASASTASTTTSSHHAATSAVVTEASRTLCDYLASSTTTDLAYSVILEHTIAERERSPAVVARCVALLKRYLLRYRPSEETLLQIDRFCIHVISECVNSPNQWLSPWSLNQQFLGPTASTNSSPSLPVSSFASGALVKSLNYVRSLVAQHIPKRSFQPAAFAGAQSASRQSLPSLSSLLSNSFNSQLAPASGGDFSENKDATALPDPNLSIIEKVDAPDGLDYIARDILKRRWTGEHQLLLVLTDSGRALDLQGVSSRNFLELGAAALLVGDIEAKMKSQPWKYFGTADMPYLHQLLQPSSVTTITNSLSAQSHLRAITTSKRSKAGPCQNLQDSTVSTFRPRARPLFQYRYYSEQQPLRLNPGEVCDVITAVGSEPYSPGVNQTVSSRLSNNSGKPSVDVAVSVLIKLVIDMYVSDSGSAAPLTLFMLEEMLSSSKPASRVRAFDLILNLGVHAHLLEPLMTDDASTIDEEYSHETFFDSEDQHVAQVNRKADSGSKLGASSAIDNFESWILNILHEILLFLVQTQEKEESVWASALSCLLFFVCDRGKILSNRLEGLDIRVIKALIVTSRKNCWAELVHSKLICILTNMFYQFPDGPTNDGSKNPVFLVEQIDLIGGIDFIFYEYSLASLREERRNLFSVLFDYVLHQINEACTSAGVSEYSDDEIQLLATLLLVADAPEAFHISVKLGVEGIGELLRRSISATLSGYSNSERLYMLLESITEKFDAIISSFSHLDEEFTHLIRITKSCKFLEIIEDATLNNGVSMKKLSWSTLHSLLHSERIPCRQNGYIWLGDLLIEEISVTKGTSIWSNISNMQKKIADAGVHDPSVSKDVPLSIWLLCGLLKSKNNILRWGFLFVLERFLMRLKFLLDENETRHSSSNSAGDEDRYTRLDKANAVIDIMSSALSLVAQINETDRMNILKMCDILFSQLCLKVLPAAGMPLEETVNHGKVHDRDENMKFNTAERAFQLENCHQNNLVDIADGKSSCCINRFKVYETTSMAAMLLQGHAIVPMQLVARVPAALFYWPLIQLAGAATDNIALGVAVGSKGRGNLPGAASDIRATLLLLLIGKCTADPSAFQEVGGEEFFRELLDDTDSRVAYYSSAFLLKRMMTEKPDEYKHMLQNLVFRAQQSNNEKLLENPYLQMRGILQLSNDGL